MARRLLANRRMTKQVLASAIVLVTALGVVTPATEESSKGGRAETIRPLRRSLPFYFVDRIIEGRTRPLPPRPFSGDFQECC
jgi:hypothetical protein